MIIYKIMKCLKIKSISKKMENKYKKQADEKRKGISCERKCRECQYGKFIKSKNVLGRGYICYLNPIEPIALGLDADHSCLKDQ